MWEGPLAPIENITNFVGANAPSHRHHRGNIKTSERQAHARLPAVDIVT